MWLTTLCEVPFGFHLREAEQEKAAQLQQVMPKHSFV